MEINEGDLIGRWKEVMTEREGKTKDSKESYSTYTFHKDSKVSYEHLSDFRRTTDSIVRFWTLHQNDGEPSISIANSMGDWNVISLDKKKLVVKETFYGLIYHFEKEW